jgi:hypothetical protein
MSYAWLQQALAPIAWRCRACDCAGLSEGRGPDLIEEILRFHGVVSQWCKHPELELASS